MPLFNIEVQRRVRLRTAKLFDLSDLFGEPLKVYISELPQTHQDTLLQHVELRQLLKEAADAKKQGKAVDVDVEQNAEKVISLQRELISVCLLDERGDRLKADDLRAFWDLMPMSADAQIMLVEMLGAVIDSVNKGSKATAAKNGAALPGDTAAETPAGK